MDLLSVFQEVWALRALIASSMVGIMCGALGAFIVLRNMSLIGDALSHAILPGVVVAFLVVGYSTLGFFVGSVIAGLIAAIGITWIQRKVQTKNDAAIGIVFTAMFSLGVIGISWVSKSGSGVHLDLKDFLFGNVLTVSDSDLILTASITAFVLLSIVALYRPLFLTTFQSVIAETMGISVSAIHYFLMLILSFAVVASLQTVGVILVVAMLITPASTALLLSSRLKTVIYLSAFLGWLAAIIGFTLAVILDTTPGPAMAVSATAIYLIAAFGAPRKGLIAKWIARSSQQMKVEIEDLLKHALKLHTRKTLSLSSISTASGFSSRKLRRYLKKLSDAGYIAARHGEVALQPLGIEKATALIRAHRLWETYLAQQVGLTAEQIHEDAEHYEHLLTADILDAVDEELGYPSQDPHGSPIPKRKSE
ncbi:MAG TPA: metal ABC transporter permease [Saprospiraceae bacterium]|nr:metal ABC transporter permease [Saprospiraceae bacterium]